MQDALHPAFFFLSVNLSCSVKASQVTKNRQRNILKTKGWWSDVQKKERLLQKIFVQYRIVYDSRRLRTSSRLCNSAIPFDHTVGSRSDNYWILFDSEKITERRERCENCRIESPGILEGNIEKYFQNKTRSQLIRIFRQATSSTLT